MAGRVNFRCVSGRYFCFMIELQSKAKPASAGGSRTEAVHVQNTEVNPCRSSDTECSLLYLRISNRTDIGCLNIFSGIEWSEVILN